jgi:hypothetical protein
MIGDNSVDAISVAPDPATPATVLACAAGKHV